MIKLSNRIKTIKSGVWVIVFFFLFIPIVNTNNHAWGGKEGVIMWDIKSYYAYLPATFIYNDLSLDFIDTNPQKFKKWIWPITTPTGKQAIVTSSGLAIMYSPFFFIAHTVAKLNPNYEADGYSKPYHYALTFAVFFYFIIGLFVLRKVLLRYFSEKVTALTLLAIGLGTNLFYYLTYSSCMPHGYNFVLIIFFIYFLEKWHDKISIKTTILLGLLGGLIALIRPTNIIVLFLIPLWRVGNVYDLKNNINLLLKNWLLIALMAACFIAIWVPQFAYWKYVSGKLFYFTYGEKDANFFFLNPQFWNVLFSYKKGWFVYTPLMFIATLGILPLFKKEYKLGIAISVYWILMVYLVASWWCWWFGGSFGLRPMIDFYGLMAIPLALVIKKIVSLKKGYQIISLSFIAFLIFFNLFNIKQQNNQALHFWWMNKEAYWSNFMKIKPSCKYWQVIMIPNYEKARKGIYEWKYSYNKERVVTNDMLIYEIVKTNRENKHLLDSLSVENDNNIGVDSLLKIYARKLVLAKKAEQYFNKLKIDYYVGKIYGCKTWKKELAKKAEKNNIAFDEMIALEAKRIHNTYGEKYVKQ